MTDRYSGSRARWLALLVLVVTFAAGALVGAAFDRAVVGGRDDGFRAGGPPPPPRGRMFGPGGPAAARLGLSAEQRQRIDSIIAEEERKADEVLEEFRPRLQARYDSTTAAILQVLNPEQREEFERSRDERRIRIERRLGGPPGGGRQPR
jgi:Spy/CpxP family protein refolding chaperone